MFYNTLSDSNGKEGNCTGMRLCKVNNNYIVILLSLYLLALTRQTDKSRTSERSVKDAKSCRCFLRLLPNTADLQFTCIAYGTVTKWLVSPGTSSQFESKGYNTVAHQRANKHKQIHTKHTHYVNKHNNFIVHTPT